MATISTLLTSKMCISPIPLSLTTKTTNIHLPKNPNSLGMLIECSSRPQKKATAHHRKTRPKKSAPWDIRRGPAVYPPLPQMPSEWSFVVEDVIEGGVGEETKEAALVEAA